MKRTIAKARPKCMRASQWLMGTWRSDKEKTIRQWDRAHAPRPQDGSQRRFAESELGKSTNRFTKSRWHHSYDGVGFSMPYRIAWEGIDEVFVVYSDGRHESGELIRFLSRSTYYVSRGQYVEFFTKNVIPQPCNPADA